jgi:hypothetical protein
MSTSSRTNQQSIKRFFPPVNVVELQEGEMVNPFPSGLTHVWRTLHEPPCSPRQPERAHERGKSRKDTILPKKKTKNARLHLYQAKSGCNRDFVGMKKCWEKKYLLQQ